MLLAKRKESQGAGIESNPQAMTSNYRRSMKSHMDDQKSQSILRVSESLDKKNMYDENKPVQILSQFCKDEEYFIQRILSSDTN